MQMHHPRSGRYTVPAILIACLLLPGAANDPRRLRKVSHIVSRADRVLQLGNLHKAEAGYEKALKLMPDLPEAHLGIGHVQMRRGNFDGAYAAYREAEARYRARAASLYELRWKRYNEAQNEATNLSRRVAILRMNIERMEALISPEGGRSAERQTRLMAKYISEVRTMEGEIERLRSIEPPSRRTEDGVPAEVYFFLGNALLNQGKIGEAVEEWKEAAARHPEYALVHNNLAVAYWRLGDLEGARREMAIAEGLGFEVNDEFARKLGAGISPDD